MPEENYHQLYLYVHGRHSSENLPPNNVKKSLNVSQLACKYNISREHMEIFKVLNRGLKDS